MLGFSEARTLKFFKGLEYIDNSIKQYMLVQLQIQLIHMLINSIKTELLVKNNSTVLQLY